MLIFMFYACYFIFSGTPGNTVAFWRPGRGNLPGVYDGDQVIVCPCYVMARDLGYLFNLCRF